MSDFLAAVGLVLVIEGLLYALLPESMKRMMIEVATIPGSNLRVGGLLAMAIGVGIVWMVRA
ncbi:DUF2065 domain-containing protein [Cohaesibacter celericrescens]|jgi:uncharacterized protein YjeT (DUF2065 family)|uniref:DUF2065 domain-containing protein n=1 Tax=Cohaesibacter celericrescens TaxID=2067669 RepID=A0A2N5XLX8_9HYPH|nr:DUF2065 domain-containing protein [Cohaesibacter celericrescens]PLW75485.1 DUF2065 domain-containing protein [Cohaesibacter celericrescens]PLW78892.1 DUF2065 domain-containing protein [Cohaesibacter celericrescens]